MGLRTEHTSPNIRHTEKPTAQAHSFLTNRSIDLDKETENKLMRLHKFETDETKLMPFDLVNINKKEFMVFSSWNFRLVTDILDDQKVTALILEKTTGSGAETIRTQAVIVDLKIGAIFAHHSLKPAELKELLSAVAKDPAIQANPNLQQALQQASEAVRVESSVTDNHRDAKTVLAEIDEKYATPHLNQLVLKRQHSLKHLAEIQKLVENNLDKSSPNGLLIESKQTPLVFQGEMAIVFPESSVEGLGTFGLGPCVGFGIRFFVAPESGGAAKEIIALGHLDEARLPRQSIDQLVDLARDWCKENKFKITGWEVYITGGQIYKSSPQSADLYHELVASIKDLKDMPPAEIKILESPVDRFGSSSLALKRSQAGYFEYQGKLTDPTEADVKALGVMIDARLGKRPLRLTVYR